MFPIAVIGGVIGAVISAAEGASWLSRQIDTAKTSASVGGKGDGKTDTSGSSTSGENKVSQFEATLAAQVAGQNQPVTATTSSSTVATTLTGPSYDTVARMKAGLIAYAQVGDHRGNDSATASGVNQDRAAARS